MDDNNQIPPNQQQQPPPGYEQYQQQPPPGYQQQYYQPPPYMYGYEGPNRPVGFLEAYKAYWKNYVNFNDRTSRAGYWWVVLMNIIISTLLTIPILIFTAGLLSYGLGDPVSSYDPYYAADFVASPLAMYSVTGFGIVYLISSLWSLANLLPGLAIGVRRLHDVGKSWVWMLIALIPIVGGIIFIVFLATAQKHPPENQFAYLRQV